MRKWAINLETERSICVPRYSISYLFYPQMVMKLTVFRILSVLLEILKSVLPVLAIFHDFKICIRFPPQLLNSRMLQQVSWGWGGMVMDLWIWYFWAVVPAVADNCTTSLLGIAFHPREVSKDTWKTHTCMNRWTKIYFSSVIWDESCRHVHLITTII